MRKILKKKGFYALEEFSNDSNNGIPSVLPNRGSTALSG
jgi:hypothetical protein